MTAKKKTFRIFWSSLIIGIFIALWIEWPSSSNNIIKYWVQPDGVSYDSYQYRISVVKKSLINPVFSILGAYRHYDISITKYSSESKRIYPYGHRKEYGFNVSDDKILELLEECTVAWEKEGIRFKEPSGHELFFPKKSFIGGR